MTMLRSRQSLWSWLNRKSEETSSNSSQASVPGSEFPPLEDNPWLSLHTQNAKHRPETGTDTRAVYTRWLSEESSPYGFADQDGTLKQVDSRTWQRVSRQSNSRRFVASAGNRRRVSASGRPRTESTWMLQSVLAVLVIAGGWYGAHAKTPVAHQMEAVFQRAFMSDYSDKVTGTFRRFASAYHIDLPAFGASSFRYHVPLTGRIVSDYSSQHPEMVIQGTPQEVVLASASGVVSKLAQSGQGYLLVIEHGDGRSTLYDGLASVSVRKGESVASGQVIGRLGSAAEPTLRFGFEQDGKFVNPHDYIVWTREPA
ncbi:MAG: M23 family metallopeptidase [Alicyclobacillus herbarius]|nr:M23 family metallopeptidase [Alicyclobacillus herbarius]